MGVRKRETADARKEANKSIAFAKLNNCPTSPRKMRLVADLVRGQKVERALNILRFSSKEASRKLEKLLLSAINNWQQKNADASIEEANLFVKEEKMSLSFILNIIDGLNENYGRILIITSNYYDKIDKALIRPGRIDIRV